MRSYSLYIVGANINCYVAPGSFLRINDATMQDTLSKCLLSVITVSQKSLGHVGTRNRVCNMTGTLVQLVQAVLNLTITTIKWSFREDGLRLVQTGKSAGLFFEVNVIPIK